MEIPQNPGTVNPTRRALIAGAAALATPALAREESEIATLHRQLIGLEHRISGVVDDDELDSLCDRRRDLEARMLAIPSHTMSDLARKVHLIRDDLADSYSKWIMPLVDEIDRLAA